MFRSDPGIVSGQRIELSSGVGLHYASSGDPNAPLLLMLHGFPECWFAWEAFMPVFSAQCHVVAPDLRGYNLSDKPPQSADYQMFFLVRDVLELIEALGHTDAMIIGHDWGGMITWAACIADPQRFRGAMILNAPHPVAFARALAGNPEQQAASRYMNHLRAPGAETALLADECAGFARFFRAPGYETWFTPESAARYRAAWQRPGVAQAMLNYYRASPVYPPQGRDAGAAALELDPAAHHVRVPVRIGWGMDDSALLPALLDPLADWVDDLTIERFPRATHWVHHEQPDAVTSLMSRFVDEFSTGR
jgi:pimeloyl-ACP methyl ester carboxylesterase